MAASGLPPRKPYRGDQSRPQNTLSHLRHDPPHARAAALLGRPPRRRGRHREVADQRRGRRPRRSSPPSRGKRSGWRHRIQAAASVRLDEPGPVRVHERVVEGGRRRPGRPSARWRTTVGAQPEHRRGRTRSDSRPARAARARSGRRRAARAGRCMPTSEAVDGGVPRARARHGDRHPEGRGDRRRRRDRQRHPRRRRASGSATPATTAPRPGGEGRGRGQSSRRRATWTSEPSPQASIDLGQAGAGILSIGPGISSSGGGTSTPTTAMRRFSAR